MVGNKKDSELLTVARWSFEIRVPRRVPWTGKYIPTQPSNAQNDQNLPCGVVAVILLANEAPATRHTSVLSLAWMTSGVSLVWGGVYVVMAV